MLKLPKPSSPRHALESISEAIVGGSWWPVLQASQLKMVAVDMRQPIEKKGWGKGEGGHLLLRNFFK